MSDDMGEPMKDLDDSILSQVASLFDAIDPPKPDLADDMLFALSLAALDAELATLENVSDLTLRTSAATATDTVTFTSSALQLMVASNPDGDGQRIDGWITGGGLKVELISGSTSHVATSDTHGRLVWREIPRGPIRFLLHPGNEDSRPVLTPKIEL